MVLARRTSSATNARRLPDISFTPQFKAQRSLAEVMRATDGPPQPRRTSCPARADKPCHPADYPKPLASSSVPDTFVWPNLGAARARRKVNSPPLILPLRCSRTEPPHPVRSWQRETHFLRLQPAVRRFLSECCILTDEEGKQRTKGRIQVAVLLWGATRSARLVRKKIPASECLPFPGECHSDQSGGKQAKADMASRQGPY
jgi:hypothetical protein